MEVKISNFTTYDQIAAVVTPNGFKSKANWGYSQDFLRLEVNLCVDEVGGQMEVKTSNSVFYDLIPAFSTTKGSK